MNEKKLNKYLDLEKWQYDNNAIYQWQGALSLHDLPRLADLIGDGQLDSDILVNLTLQKTENIIWWQLQTNGVIFLPCQRCLDMMAVSLDDTHKIALLSDKSLIKLLDDETDFMLLDEISENQKIFLLPMIEDELLMQLPLSPKHEDCEMLTYPFHEIDTTINEQTDNPFAILTTLKNLPN